MLLVLSLAIIGGGILLDWRSGVKRAYEAEEESVRAAGEPWSIADLEAWYPKVSSEANGATKYLEAYNALGVVPLVAQDSFPIFNNARETVGRSIGVKILVDLGVYLKEKESALILIREGRSYEQWRYPKEFANHWMSGSENVIEALEDVIRFSGLHAVYLGLEDDSGGATEALLDVLGIARSLENAPWIGAQNKGILAREIFCRALMEVLSTTRLSEENLITLRDQVLNEFSLSESRMRAYAGERALWLRYFERNFFERAKGAEAAFVSIVDASGAVERSLTAFCIAWARHMEILELPWPEYDRAYREVVNYYYGHATWPELFSVVPTYSLHHEVEMQLQLALTAIALERFYIARGVLPKTLAELVPEYLDGVPEDVFDSAELRYRPEGASYRLYSIGRSGRDDGGDWQRDLVFRVRRQ